jgi:hypothetical protein
MNLEIILRDYLVDIWRVDPAAITGSRELGTINCRVPWVERCDFLVSDCCV